MIRFGVAGYPLAFGRSAYSRDRLKIIDWLTEIGLDALELQMTYGPRTKPETCALMRERANSAGIKLSVHASYFIVFTSGEEEKIDRSSETLKRTYDLASQLEAKAIVLHPGPLYAGTEGDALDRFCENASACLRAIGRTDIGLFVETAGKVGQLGSFDDILRMCSRLDGVFPCIDFGHVHARTLGTLDNEGAINALVIRLIDFLKSHSNPRVHFHYTPIHYGPRGEIQHRAIKDTYEKVAAPDLFGAAPVGTSSRDGYYHPRFEPVSKALAGIDFDFTVISETHNSQEEGALALKAAYSAFIQRALTE